MTMLDPRPPVPGCTSTPEPSAPNGHRLDIHIGITTDATDLTRLAPLIAQIRNVLYHHRCFPDEGPRPDWIRYTFGIERKTRDALWLQLLEPATVPTTRDAKSTRNTHAPRRRGRPRARDARFSKPTPFLTGHDGGLALTHAPADEAERALRDVLLAYYGLSEPTQPHNI